MDRTVVHLPLRTELLVHHLRTPISSYSCFRRSQFYMNRRFFHLRAGVMLLGDGTRLDFLQWFTTQAVGITDSAVDYVSRHMFRFDIHLFGLGFLSYTHFSALSCFFERSIFTTYGVLPYLRTYAYTRIQFMRLEIHMKIHHWRYGTQELSTVVNNPDTQTIQSSNTPSHKEGCTVLPKERNQTHPNPGIHLLSWIHNSELFNKTSFFSGGALHMYVWLQTAIDNHFIFPPSVNTFLSRYTT